MALDLAILFGFILTAISFIIVFSPFIIMGIIFLATIALAIYIYFKNLKKEEKLEQDIRKPGSGNY